MGLEFYNQNKIITTDAEGSIITTHDGVSGESVDVLVYMKNDNDAYYYTNIEVYPEDDESPDDTLGIYGSGWGIKMSAGERQPTQDEWDNILAGDTISLSDIGTTTQSDTSNYYPFWLRVTVPGNLPAQIKETMFLQWRGVTHVIGS